MADPSRRGLQAHGLGRRIPGSEDWLFRGIDLELAPGRRLALIGRSGSGKTLILRALVGLDPIDEGEILWDGAPVPNQAVPSFRSQVVYLSQRPVLFAKTVGEDLKYPHQLRIHHDHDFDRDRAEELLDLAGRAPGFLERATGDLSGGERQVVALIRAILLEPRVLLLDEPTASLDDEAKRAVESLVAAWHAAEPSRSLVWVGHDRNQIDRVADDRVWIDRGRIVTGEPEA